MNQRQRKKQMLACIYKYHLYDVDGGRVKAKAMVRYASSQWTIRRICMRGTTLTEICVYFALSDERNLLAYKQDKAMALIKGLKKSRRWLCHKHHREVHGQRAVEDDEPATPTLTEKTL